MRLRLAVALGCASVLLFNAAQAGNGPFLFEGPPLPENDAAAIRLSAYQRPSGSPVQTGELPPVPVPVPIDQSQDEDEPSEPDLIPTSEAGPAEAPIPEVPAEPQVPLRKPAGSRGDEKVPTPRPVKAAPAKDPQVQTGRTQEVQPHEPPQQTPTLASPFSNNSTPADSSTGVASRGARESDRIGTIPSTETFSEEPLTLDGNYYPHSTGSRMSCICCADVSLPELRQPYVFDEFGVELGGWVEAGFSAAGASPDDRFNGPVTFNDRHAEAQMNQLWLYLERKPNTWADSLDLGGRIDVMYGTDAQFIQARDGLEEDWRQSERFYQMALPQFYLDVTRAGWTVRMGKFFTILGYERPAAPENFFYSHAYTMQYGEPFTHMGMLVSRRFGRWIVNAGFHRGNDQFDDTDGLDALNFLGGIGYVTYGEWASAEYALSSTENGPGVLTYTHSLVNTIRVTERLDYVLQGDYGAIQNEGLGDTSAWWGINQYFIYTLNPCWAAALRVEWFRDRDGTRVSGLRHGNQTPTELAGNFYEVTLGLNWLPRTNLRIRPEVRWDIFDPIASTTGHPYDAGNSDHQFMFGCDVIYNF